MGRRVPFCSALQVLSSGQPLVAFVAGAGFAGAGSALADRGATATTTIAIGKRRCVNDRIESTGILAAARRRRALVPLPTDP
jgi:hypothetical protein